MWPGSGGGGKAKAKSRWKKAGRLVKMGLSVKNLINTGFEVIDGVGLPVKLVDEATGEETLEVLPLGCSLNLVRRTARSTFGYVRQVMVHTAPLPAPGQGDATKLGRKEDRTRARRGA